MKDVIISLDIGSTGIHGSLVSTRGIIVKREYRHLPKYQNEPGAVEYNPEEMWNLCYEILTHLVKKNKGSRGILAIGVSAQRATFCLREKKGGNAVTPFYSWADIRAVSTVDRMNKSITWKMFRVLIRIGAFFTRSVFLKAVSMLHFTPVLASCRLRWVFDTNPELERRSRSGELLFSTIENWILYKLSGNRENATEVSCAASTSLYNHFTFRWNTLFCGLFDIPVSIFPKVKETVYNYCDAELPGGGIVPVTALCGDQMASLFGNRCFTRGDVKVSLGSGGFITVFMGKKPGLSKRGLFPLLAWTIDGIPYYMLEGQVSAVGSMIDWVEDGLGLAATARELDKLVDGCDGSGEVVVLPTPHGIGFPHFFPRIKSAVFGLNLRTRKNEVAYALYEGLAMAIKEILDGISRDIHVRIPSIRVDGGVSRSRQLMQILANVTGKEVYAAREPEMNMVGTAFLAGMGAGIWKNPDSLPGGSEKDDIHEQFYIQYLPGKGDSYRSHLEQKWQSVLKSVITAT